jgi:hypothetical protein
VQYRTRAWQTIEVDLGPAKASDIDLVEPSIPGIVELGLPPAAPLRCLGLPEQIAQKLHACTGPHSSGRARDVLDVLLIDALSRIDYPRTAEAAVRVFAERASHVFPPQFVMPAAWRPEIEAMAVELGLPYQQAGDIERRFTEVIQTLADSVLEPAYLRMAKNR